MTGISQIICLLCGLVWSASIPARVSVTDDEDRVVALPQPAARVISLAPHLTELLYAAGAEGQIVGTVRYSDYPSAAKSLPLVGDANNLDLEAIFSLQPDLLLGWTSGNSLTQLKQLERLKLPLYLSEPESLTDIAATITDLGILTGNEDVAEQAAANFRSELKDLKHRYHGRKPVQVFYQIWGQPLITIAGDHLIDQIISLCGGNNIFASMQQLAPAVDTESVLAADPDIIIASGDNNERPYWLDEWQQWSNLKAVRNDQIYHINPDLLQRHSPRILEGAAIMCKQIDTARQHSGLP
ncbi:MAG: cobalamin-binding protein [Gammaproteobacteria bacterium]